MMKRYNEFRKGRLLKKLDSKIRFFSQSPGKGLPPYFQISISEQENATLMDKERDVIKKVFEKYSNEINKYLTQEEAETVYNDNYARMNAMGVIRRKGLDCELSDLERYEQLDLKYSASSQTNRYIYKYKMAIIKNEKSKKTFKTPIQHEGFVKDVGSETKREAPKPLLTWAFMVAADKQKLPDEYNTKFPSQLNRALGNIAVKKQQPGETAEQYSTVYPQHLNNALANIRKQATPER